MRFSLFYNFDILPGKSVSEMYREVEAQAVVADTLGFDAVWLAEHHFELYGRMPDPLLYLARLSGLTKKIGLGTAIIEAPHYNPFPSYVLSMLLKPNGKHRNRHAARLRVTQSTIVVLIGMAVQALKSTLIWFNA